MFTRTPFGDKNHFSQITLKVKSILKKVCVVFWFF